jgi:hypothetical protein
MKTHIPLTKRGLSTSSNDNVLVSLDNIYIMDNHRLALWCWFQEIEKDVRYNLLHIDAHPDLSESALPYFHHDLWSMDLSSYRETWQNDINEPLFRWDNYIEVFLQKYPHQVAQTFSATHQLGSQKKLSNDIKPFDLLKFTTSVFTEKNYINESPWVVNLDLDYFFSAAPEKCELFSDEYVAQLSRAIECGLNNKMIKVLTISLSPECCGSWEKAEKLLAKFGFGLT